jgi:hypothetical protein
VLPGATSAEGIARGAGTTFYAGDLFGGDIYRGDGRKGTVEKFIDNAPGRNAVGMRVDLDDGRCAGAVQHASSERSGSR